ncbi:hypothetical protein CERSUDRAFT_97042 [Gelatoporia subvermispora B]|uniref:CCHC-type domain-containing protein n=1 Tax=Ceriporiopsis subvermispora (strain B) TaxID=914234 RepID=M2R8R9_CERS8|nr:hypothetical protein CERSUDRAFT_97042 [Gelatoporia subvermispora B]
MFTRSKARTLASQNTEPRTPSVPGEYLATLNREPDEALDSITNGPAVVAKPPPALGAEETSRVEEAEEEVIRSVLLSETLSEKSDTGTSAVIEAGRNWLSHVNAETTTSHEPTGCDASGWGRKKDAPPHLTKEAGDSEAISKDVEPPDEQEAAGERCAGPSSLDKGKSVDPNNWGALEIDLAELDPHVQQRELDSYYVSRLQAPQGDRLDSKISQPVPLVDNQSEVESLKAELHELKLMFERALALKGAAQPMPEAIAEVPQVRETVKERGVTGEGEYDRGAANKVVEAVMKPESTRETRPRFSSLQPITQVEPEGFLGKAFSDLKGRRARRSRRSMSPAPGDSCLSDESEAPSSHGYSLEFDVGGGGSTRRSKTRAEDKHPRLKPHEPETYSGQADIEKFYKFMEQSKEYLAGYRLSKKRYAFSLSHFTSGKAYSFYTLVVLGNPSEWSLHELFIGLFNYCFPADFHDRMRDKLDNFSQGNMSVREYSHELQRMFRVVDDFTKTQKVRKLWRGFKGYIIEGLISKEMSPTTESWKVVLHAAEVLEEAARAKERANKRAERAPGSASKQQDARDPKPKGHGNPKTHTDQKSRSPVGRDLRGAAKVGSTRQDGRKPKPPKHEHLKLTPEECAQLAAEGKCYLCKETGHFAQNCPRAAKVKTHRKDRAPGIYSSNIEFGHHDTEELQELASRTVFTMELELNCVGIGPQAWYAASVLDVTSDEAGLLKSRSVTYSWKRAMAYSPEDLYDTLPGLASVSDSSDDGWCSSDNDDGSEGDSMPILDPVSDSSSEEFGFSGDESEWCLSDREDSPCAQGTCPLQLPYGLREGRRPSAVGEIFAKRAQSILLDLLLQALRIRLSGPVPSIQLMISISKAVLSREEPTPCGWVTAGGSSQRFICTRDEDTVQVWDTYLCIYLEIPLYLMYEPRFDLANYYARMTHLRLGGQTWTTEDVDGKLVWLFDDDVGCGALDGIELAAVRVAASDTYTALQRNAATSRDFKRSVPEPVVVVVRINGEPARTLLDSGSLADFMSAKLAHQLGIKTFELAKPLPVHLAVQGSRAKINLGCTADVDYQGIWEPHYFDVVNLLNYDLILGTPFLFQHQVLLGLNPTKVIVGSLEALPIEGKSVRVLESRAADLFGERLDSVRAAL